MSDVGYDIVGLLKHPVVAPGDGIAWVDRLDSLREHGIGVVVVFRLLAGHIGQHDRIVDLWVHLFDRLQRVMHIGIKLALMPHIGEIFNNKFR